MTNNCYKGWSYVQDTDENLAPSGVSSESYHPNLIISLSLIQIKTTFEPETQFQNPRTRPIWSGHSLPRPATIFKGCPYVQDTDEKLAPLGQNPKRTVAYSTLPKWSEIPPKTKSNLINPRNKPGKPQSQNPNPQPFPFRSWSEEVAEKNLHWWKKKESCSIINVHNNPYHFKHTIF